MSYWKRQEWEEKLSGWRKRTGGAFGLQMFPGAHLFMHDDRELLLQTYISRTDVTSELVPEAV